MASVNLNVCIIIIDVPWRERIWRVSFKFKTICVADDRPLGGRPVQPAIGRLSATRFSPSKTFFSTHAYAAAKSAVIGFSKSAAAYYAPHNVRFNVIAPSVVETPMAARAASNPEIREFLAHKQPLDGGRIGQPSDVDAAVVYFLSDGSKFVTGQVLSIDGGWCVSE